MDCVSIALGQTSTALLATMQVERLADLGPHFKCLSPRLQEKAREDWLDRDFLQSWINGIKEVQIVAAESDLAFDLMSLTD